MTDKKAFIILGIVLAATFIARLGVLSVAYSADPASIMAGDAADYDNTALALHRLGHFAVSPDRPDVPQTFRAPAYSAFIGGLYFLFGERRFPIVVVQIFLSLVTLLLAYVLARELWGTPEPALLAAILLAADHLSLTFSGLLNSETLFTLLLTAAATFGAGVIIRERKMPLAFMMGSCLALATLARPVGYYLLFPVLAGLAACGRSLGWRWKATARILLLASLPFLVLVGSWQWRNWRLTGDASISQGIKGFCLLLCKGQDIIKYRDRISQTEVSKKLLASLPDTKEWPMWKLDRLYTEKGMELIRNHPLLFLRSFTSSILQMMLVPGETELMLFLGVPYPNTGAMGDLLRLPLSDYLKKWPLGHPFLFLAFLLALAHLGLVYAGVLASPGALLKTSRERVWAALFLVGVALYFLPISAISTGHPRYRVPIMPLLAIFSGQGWFFLWNTAKGKGWLERVLPEGGRKTD